MFRRDLSQPSFADAFVTGYARGFLEEIGETFNWGAFGGLLAPIHSSTKGAPGYPPLTMFKIILLQQWHTLSDPAAEEAVRDRLSFRRFCGLPLDRETPDHASMWRFRQTIDKLGLSRALLWPRRTGSSTRADLSSSAARWWTQRRSPRRSGGRTKAAASMSAIPTRASPGSATRPISATSSVAQRF